MLQLKKGVDILADTGGVKTIHEAKAIIEQKLDAGNLEKLAPIKNEEALLKIANAIALCEPDDVFIDTGSEADTQWVREYSLRKGEEKKLAKEGHTIHFDLPQDQARLVNQTFYIVNEGENLSALAKSTPRAEALEYVRANMRGIMKGMSMLIGFFSRGPAGADAAIPAIEMSRRRSSTAIATTASTQRWSARACSSPICTPKAQTDRKMCRTPASSWIGAGSRHSPPSAPMPATPCC